jgi:hypothetical protein
MLNSIGRFLTKNWFHNPILVVGAGRSGTSIMLQALGEHSLILSADRESPFLPYVGYLAHPFEFRDNRDYHRDSLNMPVEEAYGQLRKLCFEAVFGADYGLQGRLKDVGRREALRKRYWCAKTFPNAVEAKGLTRLYPNIKFIYMFRNGYDVVNSRSRFRGMSSASFEEHCRVWAAHTEKYAYLCEMEEAVPVRQEDVAADPDGVFQRVQAFIGLPFEDGPSKFAKSTLIHSLDRKTEQQVNVSQVFEERRPIYESWTPEQRTTFKTLCGAGMDELGYEIPF